MCFFRRRQLLHSKHVISSKANRQFLFGKCFHVVDHNVSFVGCVGVCVLCLERVCT